MIYHKTFNNFEAANIKSSLSVGHNERTKHLFTKSNHDYPNQCHLLERWDWFWNQDSNLLRKYTRMRNSGMQCSQNARGNTSKRNSSNIRWINQQGLKNHTSHLLLCIYYDFITKESCHVPKILLAEVSNVSVSQKPVSTTPITVVRPEMKIRNGVKEH